MYLLSVVMKYKTRTQNIYLIMLVHALARARMCVCMKKRKRLLCMNSTDDLNGDKKLKIADVFQ